MSKKSIFRAFLIILTLCVGVLLSGCDQLVTTTEEPNTTVDSTTETKETATTEAQTTITETVITTTNKWGSYEPISIKEALSLSSSQSDTKYYVSGTIKSISNATYGECIITDGTDEIAVYGIYSSDGSLKYSEMTSRPVVGDEVLLYASIGVFKETPELKQSWLINFIHNNPVDTGDYTSLSIADARRTKVQITGNVASITYTQSMAANGFLLVSNESSIYVYGSDVVASVSVGNTVTLNGTIAHFISTSEASNAEKYGYKGSLQVTSATVIKNDNQVTDFDASWATVKTMKELMDTDVSKMETALIYKVNAYIKKEAGASFINYYIDDFDEATGSYVYSSNSGSDFGWLEEYNGKTVTLYLTVINAKSTASGCIYRLLPVKVIGEYTFDKAKAAEFAVEYFGAKDIKEAYTGDPALEVKSSITSTAMGVENLAISYQSDNENVVYFEVKDGVTIMHTKNAGTANVTIAATYDGVAYEKKVLITVTKAEDIKALTVKEAIDTADQAAGETITVKGVVSAWLVNQCGFYLIDETGVIAVKTSGANIKTLSLGQTVIVKGQRTHFNSASTKTAKGESCILDAEIVQNLEGSVAYSKASFITDKTLADIVNFNTTSDDPTTVVYVIKATLTKANDYNYTLKSGELTLQLYSSSLSQYSWLSTFEEKEITVEVAICNWNGKSVFKCCVLSATDGTTTVANGTQYIK